VSDPAPAPSLRVDLGPGVLAAFTGRRPGVSVAPYDEANLAAHVGDDPEAVARNRAVLARWVGVPVVFGRQVHGTRALLISPSTAPDDPLRQDAGDHGGCDALVTATTRVGIGVLVADCVPVLLADSAAGVVAVAHAGRVGLLAGVLQATLEAMTGLGAREDRIRVALGPSAGPCCYEVGEQVHAQACAVIPALHSRTTWGRPSLDLRAGCAAVLGDRVASLTRLGGCTIEDPSSYSYRRASQTGRQAGVVRLLP
jgi:YfiH family protein